MANKRFYFDVRGRSTAPFQIYIGGRGVGKTYSALDDVISGDYQSFLYLRRSQKEIESVASGYANPFKRLNLDKGYEVESDYIKAKGFGTFTYKGELKGYSASLSTFSNLRSIDLSDVDIIVYDEFIPEKHRSKMKNECDALLNLYETVNRNREIQGKPPVKLILLANSISLASPVLIGLNIVPVIQHMIDKGHNRFTDRDRGLYVELVADVGITEAKRKTALYKLTANTDFGAQALENEFSSDRLDLVKNVRLIEYKPVFTFDIYTCYVHKANKTLYMAVKSEKATTRYTKTQGGQLRREFGMRYCLAIDMNRIYFDSYDTKVYFDEILA